MYTYHWVEIVAKHSKVRTVKKNSIIAWGRYLNPFAPTKNSNNLIKKSNTNPPKIIYGDISRIIASFFQFCERK